MPITYVGGGNGLQNLVQVLLNKEKMAQQKEMQALQKKQIEMQMAQHQFEQNERQLQAKGATIAAQIIGEGLGYQQGLQVIGGFDDKLKPYILGSLAQMGQAQNIYRQGTVSAGIAETTQEDIIATTAANRAAAQAGATSAEVQARVDVATEGTQVEQVQANLTDTTLRNQMNAEVLRGSDPVNGARALGAWIQSGGNLTWGEVTEAVGFTGKTNIDPSLRYEPPTQGTGGADATEARTFLTLMQGTHQEMQRLHQAGVRLSLGGGIVKASGGGFFGFIGNKMLSEEEQTYLTAMRNFADYYRFSLSGQQSGEAERKAMLLAITPQWGDADETIALKTQLRGLMLQDLHRRSGGTMTAVQAATRARDLSRRLTGVRVEDDEGNIITAADAFQRYVDFAREEEEEGKAGGARISGIPGQNTINDVPSIVEQSIRRHGGSGG